MRVSIIICTWNRAESLRLTLSRLTSISKPVNVAWELVVVNNRCTDHTDAVISEFSSRLPLRRVYEDKPGISNARNAGVQAATGEYLVWTDDDVLPDENWLTGYVEAFRQWPEAALFGGPIRPLYEGTPPRWLVLGDPELRNPWGIRELGDEPRKLTEEGNILPYGSNYAVRAVEQRRFRYDPSLGRRQDGVELMGEETAVIRAILRAGCTGYWVPGPGVQHRIPKVRQTLRYICHFFEGRGYQVGLAAGAAHGPHAFLGVPYWLWKRLVETHVRYWAQRMTCGPAKWTTAMLEASEARGQWKARVRARVA